MKHPENAYLNALKDILENGEKRPDRTGVGTISKFGLQMRFDLEQGFPAVTTKKLAWKSVVSELLWFIEGSGDEFRLKEILHGERYTDKKTIWSVCKCIWKCC
jgi:thymidylate synthase